MDARSGGRQYEDFEPNTNWVEGAATDTLNFNLPGFKKEQLRVQVTSNDELRVAGERQVGGNKWSRFRKEMRIPSKYNSNKISASFENGTLHVKFPKLLAETSGEAKPAMQPTEPPQPAPTAKPQVTGQKRDTKEPPKAEKVPAKPTEEEKPKISTADKEKPKGVKEEGKKADEDRKGPETAIPQKKSQDLAATEKDQKRGDSDNAAIGKKMEEPKTKNAGDIGKYKAEDHKENFGSSNTKLKKPINLINTMVAILLIVVLGLYVKHAFGSLGPTIPDPEL